MAAPDKFKMPFTEFMPVTALGCCILSCIPLNLPIVCHRSTYECCGCVPLINNLDFPACISCDVACGVFGVEAECIGCEPGCRLKWPTTCIKTVFTCCCIDFRAALPPCDNEIPCLFTICCLTLWYRSECRIACAQRIGRINPELDFMNMY